MKKSGQSTRKPLTEAAPMRTFQMRLPGSWPTLDDLARRYNAAKRITWAECRKANIPFTKFKSDERLDQFTLPSRLHNAIATDLNGMVRSKTEKAKGDAASVQDRLEQAAKVHTKLKDKLTAKREENAKAGLGEAGTGKLIAAIQHKTQSIQKLTAKLGWLLRQAELAFPSLCFGSRALFNAQHHLEDNKYADHAAWKANWQASRESQFLVVGSADEVGGNKTCKAVMNDDGTVTLHLQTHEGRGTERLILPNLRLPHGHAEWLQAVEAGNAEAAVSLAWQRQTAKLVADLKAEGRWSHEAEAELRKARKAEREAQPKTGGAVTYRFVKDKYGWRVFVTVQQAVTAILADYSRGAIGLDLNEGHIARTRVAADGSVVDYRRLDLVMYGRSTGQRLAVLHRLADELVKEAKGLGVPLCIEKLDFSAKKARLREVGCEREARRLSSFAYARFATILKAHARLHGVAVIEVEPAYTSVIGAALHAVPNGLSVHGAAAQAIARRAMGLEETVPERLRVWRRTGGGLTMARPERLRSKATVDPWWSGWRELSKAVHAARELAKAVRRTGSQRREERRLLADAAIPY